MEKLNLMKINFGLRCKADIIYVENGTPPFYRSPPDENWLHRLYGSGTGISYSFHLNAPNTSSSPGTAFTQRLS